MAEKKKRQQQKQSGTHQPRDADHTSRHHVQKPGDADTGKQKNSGFSEANSTFSEENGTEQDERKSGDDYRRRDTYHQSEKKGRYRWRKHTDRERTETSDSGRDFQTKDGSIIFSM